MKKLPIYLILLMFSLTITIIPIGQSQVNEPQNIQVVDKSWYIDLYGNLVVVGQVQNVGQDTIDQIVLIGSATTNDQLQQSSYTKVWASNLVPQQKAPFYMEFLAPQSSFGAGSWYDNVADVSLTVTLANATDSYQYPDLTITNSHGSIGTSGDFNGAYVVNGNIKNTGSQAATNVTVVGAFFNSTGSVVGVGYTNYLSPRTLNPSETTSFQIAALDLNQTEVPNSLKITSYELLVQTEGPLLQGAAPQATPYSGSGNDGTSENPTPTLAPGQTSTNGNAIGNLADSQTQLIVIGVVIAIIVIAAAFLLMKKRNNPKSIPPATKPAPTYKPKATKRNRK